MVRPLPSMYSELLLHLFWRTMQHARASLAMTNVLRKYANLLVSHIRILTPNMSC